jgi:hypothetical protein
MNDWIQCTTADAKEAGLRYETEDEFERYWSTDASKRPLAQVAREFMAGYGHGESDSPVVFSVVDHETGDEEGFELRPTARQRATETA